MKINGKIYTRENIGKVFDYSMLNPDVTEEQVTEHVRRGILYNVNGVYCNPYWVPLVADMLEGTGIETGLCPSFPFGASPLSIKVRETEEMVEILNGRPGCVDYVINIGALKSKDYKVFREEANTMVQLGHANGLKVKSIMENAMLTDEELAAGCQIMSEAGVDYVKAASGRGGIPAMRTIFIMRKNVSDRVGIKYSGFGAYNPTQHTIMGLASGATLIGTFYAHQIIEEICKYYMDLEINLQESI